MSSGRDFEEEPRGSNNQEVRGKLADLQKYIEKNAVKLPDGTPIFSARYFINMIKEAKQAFLKLYPEEELGGTLERLMEVKRELVRVQKEVHGITHTDDARELAVLDWFATYFGGVDNK